MPGDKEESLVVGQERAGVQPRLFRMIGSYPIRKPPSKRNATQPPNRLPQPAGKARA